MGRIIILRLFDSYFRHRWLYLLPILVMAIFAVVYTLTREHVYISSGVIFTEQTSLLSSLTSVQSEGFSWNTPAQDTTNQISDLIRTDAFIRAVIQGTDLEAEMDKGEPVVRETIYEVRRRIWASVAGTSQVQISAANTNPHIAYQLAQSTIDTFIQWKINLDRTDSVTAGDFFQELIQGYRTDVTQAQQTLRSYLEAHPEPVRGARPDTEELEIQRLQADLDFAGTRLAQALDKAEEARLAETQVESNIRQKYTVVDAPGLPDRPATSRRQIAMNASVFLAVGALLSVIAVLGATVIERSFRTPLDVKQALDLPVLAVVPDVPKQNQKKRFRIWKRKKLSPTETGKTNAEELEEAPIALNLLEEVPELIQKEKPRRRKKKEPAPSEISETITEKPEETPIALELQALEVDFKSEQKIER
jgi:capsular polysaccharide biosynthesis protein